MDWSAPNLPAANPNSSVLNTSPPVFSQLSLDPRIQYQLSRVDKSVPFVPIKRYLHHTWAQTFFSRPELFFQPASIPELQKIVTLARRCRKRLCVTGFGHSPSTLTCTSSWLINLDGLSRILEIDIDGKPGHVRFEAGISLHNLNQQLAKHGYTLPNLGSIDVQSLAGAISTGTHGSSLRHGLLSQSVTSLTILLSNSQLVTCSAQKNPDLFKAALCSLGSLGIIVEMTFQAVPDFNISWEQSLHPLSEIIETWPTTLWTQKEYTRVWWLPYTQRGVLWRAERSSGATKPPSSSFYGGMVGYYVYHNLLALSNHIPRILPWIEWFIFGMQYGFKPGSRVTTAIEPARQGLLMDCLYSQFVNEWAIPLSKGPEAITRLSAWINHDEETAHIPFSSKGVWVHCPIEVRVTDTSPKSATNKSNVSGVRPFLDPTAHDEPTLYLNATLYRPYGKDPPCHKRYYEAFEWLMKELGGRPHWAKNFAYTDVVDIETMYKANPTNNMGAFMKIRDEVDPEGMFLGEWHVRNLPVNAELLNTVTDSSTITIPSSESPVFLSSATSSWSVPKSQSTSNKKQKEKATRRSLVEGETGRKRMGYGWGDGVLWSGSPLIYNDEEEDVYDSDEQTEGEDEGSESKASMSMVSMSTFDSMTSRTSEESFDLMAKGEASILHLGDSPSPSYPRSHSPPAESYSHSSTTISGRDTLGSDESGADDADNGPDLPNFDFKQSFTNSMSSGLDTTAVAGSSSSSESSGLGGIVRRDTNPESGFGFFD